MGSCFCGGVLDRSFRFIVVLPIILFFLLCVWQCRRAEWKEALLARYSKNINLPLLAHEGRFIPLHIYRQLRVYGMSLPGVYKIRGKHNGHTWGCDIYQRFKDNNGRVFLVRRGFSSSCSSSFDSSVGYIEGYLRPIPSRYWWQQSHSVLNKKKGEYRYIDPLIMRVTDHTYFIDIEKPSLKGIPNNHRQYAITWGLLLFVWIFVSYIYVRRRC